MKFTDKQFKNDKVVALSFRKPIYHEADKVAELAEEMCDEIFDLKFQGAFSSSSQDLATSTVSKELEVDEVERDVRQGGQDWG